MASSPENRDTSSLIKMRSLVSDRICKLNLDSSKKLSNFIMVTNNDAEDDH